MTADCIGAPLQPSCRDARWEGSAWPPAARRPQPRLGALHRPGGGGVAPVSGRVAACPAVCPGGPGGGPCLSRRVSRPVCEGGRSTSEAKPSTPEALAWACRCDASLSGGVGRPIGELLARVSATGAGYAADRWGLWVGLARREIFGLASASVVLASPPRHGRPGRGAGRLGFCTGRPGLWGGRAGRRGCREHFRACRAHRPGRRGGRLGWFGWPGRGRPEVFATGDAPPRPMRQLRPHPAARGAFRSEPEFRRARHLKPQKQPKQDLTGDAIAQHTPMMMQWCMYHC